MMTIGDVLGVAGLLFAMGVCSWAVMMASAVLFPRRASLAKDCIEAGPASTLLMGLCMTLVLAFLGIALLSAAVPLLKLVGWFVLTGTLAVGAVGSGGVALLMGERLRVLQPDMSPYAAVCRGAAIVFLCALTPILGTFLFAPAALATSVGAGIKALRHREIQTKLA